MAYMQPGLPWAPRFITPTRAREDYPSLWQTASALFPHMTPDELSRVAALVVDTCHACRNAPRDCQCWNDD